jgi:hypothetical protein
MKFGLAPTTRIHFLVSEVMWRKPAKDAEVVQIVEDVKIDQVVPVVRIVNRYLLSVISRKCNKPCLSQRKQEKAC